MRTLWITLIIAAGLTASKTSADAGALQDRSLLPARAIPLAQDATQLPSLSASDAAARQHELQEWIHSFTEWKKWMDQWGNQREPGWFSDYRKRRQEPEPPPWLSGVCDTSPEDSGTIADACTLLAEWRTDYATARISNIRVAASSGKEDTDKTIWWEHVHLDLAWPAMQSGLTYFGVIGMHATTSVRGRLEIFVAPGAMLLNVPTRNGGRAWKIATNYGIAYRLGQFRFPGNRRALLHVNLAKAWLFAAGPDVPTKSTDFIGLSVTFKKTP
jgi:hypothetical protein